ncbi:MAG: hypothetical protein IKJ63_01480 [Clostridia bacterium]|nr:hypothetical protein [Clostridia bacterium]
MKRKIKNYLCTACILLFAVWLFVTAFYTYGNMTEENTQSCSVEIMNAEKDDTFRKKWLIVHTADGDVFYCLASALPMPAREAIDRMLENTVFPATATVSYSTRKNLLPTNFLEFTNYKSMVSLSVDGNCVIGLEHLNQYNRSTRIGFVIASVICLLPGIALVFLQLLAGGYIEPWTWHKKRRKRK